MLPVERQSKILSILQTDGFVQVSHLSVLLGVSELTIRRDLDQMASLGKLERTHGGALVRKNLNVEQEYSLKAKHCFEEKEAIGRKAASLVSEGDIIYVNSGSTTAQVLRFLLESGKQLTIVTNNIDVFKMEDTKEKCTIIFIGGTYRSKSHSVSGTLSTLIASNIYANKAFIGVDGFSSTAGLTTPIFEESVATEKMIEQTAGKIFVVASHDKIGVVSNFKTTDADKVHAIITDENGSKLLGEDPRLEIEIITA